MTEHVLIDPELDRRLQRDGFVVAPLIDAATASGLRSAYLDRVGVHDDRLLSDMQVDDIEYRRWAAQELRQGLDGPTAALFVDHRPFMRHFLAQFPGDNSGSDVQRDWMWVDERAHERSYVVWVALEDITGHNGQLRVIRGSHRLDGMLRGADLTAPWLAHEGVLEDRLLAVPLEAGQCVVLDGALVHASYPNHTDVPRVAAVLATRRVGAGLVHYRRRDEWTADAYQLDEETLELLTSQELLGAAPQRPELARTAIDEVRLSPKQLVSALDAGALNRLDRIRHRMRTVVSNVVTEARERAGAARRHRADHLGEPHRTHAGGRVADALRELPSKAAIAVLAANEASIDRFGPTTRGVWDPHEFPWVKILEDGWPDVRREVDALLHGPTEIPHIEDVTGGIPQGNVGPWRVFGLMHQGHWMDWNCRRCPATTALVKNVPDLMMAGFSVLEPGTHITKHRGPNKGALRYQLGVVVPGEPGDCRIRIGEEMVVWQEGESVVFDFTVPHEAWNDTDAIRVLLMLEFIAPLPWYLAGTNRVAQRAMGWFPTTRDMKNRLRRLEPTLQKVDSAG